MSTRNAIMNGVSALAFGALLGFVAPAAAQEASAEGGCADEGLGFLYEDNAGGADCAKSEDSFLDSLDSSPAEETAETDMMAEDEAPAETAEAADESAMPAEEAAIEEPMGEEPMGDEMASEEPAAEEPAAMTEETAAADEEPAAEEETAAAGECETAEEGTDGVIATECADTAAAEGEETSDDMGFLADSDAEGEGGDDTTAEAATEDSTEEDTDLDALFGDAGDESATDETASDETGSGDAGEETASDDTGDTGSEFDTASDDTGSSSGDGDELSDPNMASGSVGGDAEDPGVDDSLVIAADDDGTGDGSGGVTDAANNGFLLAFGGPADGTALIGVGVSPDLSQLIVLGDPSNLDSLIDIGVGAPAGDQAALINATVADGLDDGFASLVGLDLGGDSNLGENSNLVQATLGSTFAPIADALAGQTTVLAPLAAILDIGVQN